MKNWIKATLGFVGALGVVGALGATNTITSIKVPLDMILGGTGAILTPDNGGILYSTGAALGILPHTTTTGVPLLGGNATTPSWGTDPNLAYLDKAQSYTKGQGVTPTTLSSCGGTITPDGTSSNHYECVLTSNLTLNNPTTITPGFDYTFRFVQPSSGAGFTLTLGNAYAVPLGQAPALSTAANAVDLLTCTAHSSTEIDCNPLSQGLTAAVTQSLVMAAVITPNATNSSNLNYQTGCATSPGAMGATFGSNHNCLMFDDHWTTTPTGNTKITAFNTNNWFLGNMRCNGGTGGNANCTIQTVDGTGGGVNYPYSGWCWGGDPSNNGCQSVLYWDWPIGQSTNPSSLGTTTQIAADGSLQYNTISVANSTLVSASNCTNPTNNEFLQCPDMFWLGAALTTGGLPNPSGDNNLPTTLNNLIPATGGMIQIRMKMDAGVASGMYPAFECDGVDDSGGVNGAASNANMEFGYHFGNTTDPKQGLGFGLNNTANQTGQTVLGSISGTVMTVTTADVNGQLLKVGNMLHGAGISQNTKIVSFGTGSGGTGTYNVSISQSVPANTTIYGAMIVATGDDGVGLGDVTNWHTYALEYTGSTHLWNYYIDNVPYPVGGTANTHTETNLVTRGYTCVIGTGSNGLYQSSYHSEFDPNNPGGPFHMWISDVQVYKKPGT